MNEGGFPGAASGNATQLQGRAILNAAPADTNVLTWVAANNDWEPAAGGGGGGAPANAPYVTTAADAGLSNETLIGAVILAPDVVLNRPAAALAGRIFFATDTKLAYRDNGASWDALAFIGNGALLAANNLSDLANVVTARTNLGLGTIATQAANNVAITGGAITGVAVVATDPIWAAKGDLAIGTANDAAAILASSGVVGETVYVQPGEATGMIYGQVRSGSDRYLARTSALAETMQRIIAASNAVAISTGQLRLQAIYLPKGVTITNLGMTSGITGANTPTHWWFTLCDSARTHLRSTADQTSTAWAANTEKVLALASAFVTTYEGLHYVGVMMAATATVSLMGINSASANLVGQTPIAGGTSTGALTTPPADGTVASAITVTNSQLYEYAT